MYPHTVIERRHPQILVAKLLSYSAVHLCLLRSTYRSYTSTVLFCFLSLQNTNSAAYNTSTSLQFCRHRHGPVRLGSLLGPKAEIKASAGPCSRLDTARQTGSQAHPWCHSVPCRVRLEFLTLRAIGSAPGGRRPSLPRGSLRLWTGAL